MVLSTPFSWCGPRRWSVVSRVARVAAVEASEVSFEAYEDKAELAPSWEPSSRFDDGICNVPDAVLIVSIAFQHQHNTTSPPGAKQLTLVQEPLQ